MAATKIKVCYITRMDRVFTGKGYYVHRTKKYKSYSSTALWLCSRAARFLPTLKNGETKQLIVRLK